MFNSSGDGLLGSLWASAGPCLDVRLFPKAATSAVVPVWMATQAHTVGIAGPEVAILTWLLKCFFPGFQWQGQVKSWLTLFRGKNIYMQGQWARLARMVWCAVVVPTPPRAL